MEYKFKTCTYIVIDYNIYKTNEIFKYKKVNFFF